MNKVSSVLIIGPYDDKLSPGIDCSVEPSMTKQEFKSESDINNIMSRFERTGVDTFASDNEQRYSDATAVDFQSAMNLVIQAESMFSEMPASLRKRFDNDPAEFLRYIDDPANIEDSIKLGLRRPPVVPPAPTIQKVEIVPPTPLPPSPAPS